MSDPFTSSKYQQEQSEIGGEAPTTHPKLHVGTWRGSRPSDRDP